MVKQGVAWSLLLVVSLGQHGATATTGRPQVMPSSATFLHCLPSPVGKRRGGLFFFPSPLSCSALLRERARFGSKESDVALLAKKKRKKDYSWSSPSIEGKSHGNLPSDAPSGDSSNVPSVDSSIDPGVDPGVDPSNDLTSGPSGDPSSDPSGDPSSDPGKEIPQQTTLQGGPSLIFEMARRMLVWDDELYQGLNDASSSKQTLQSAPPSSRPMPPPPLSPPLPRWRPSQIPGGISNSNPAFRTSSPIMTNAGYAAILRRNSRKRNKPSMWRHCLRVYDRMRQLESTSASPNNNASSNNASNNNASKRTRRKKLIIKRTTAHHEAALVAASKLGMWEEALFIFDSIQRHTPPSETDPSTSPNSIENQQSSSQSSQSLSNSTPKITDNMILSLVSACVKGSRMKQTLDVSSITTTLPIMPTDNENITIENDKLNGQTTTTNETIANVTSSQPIERNNNNSDNNSNTVRRGITRMRSLSINERRKPLDAARDILLSIEKKYDLPLVARHINPLASAYLRLGLRAEANHLLKEHLKDRIPPPPKPSSYRKKKYNADTSLSSSRYDDEDDEKSSFNNTKNDDEDSDENDSNGFAVAIPLISWNEEKKDLTYETNFNDNHDVSDDNDDHDDGYNEDEENFNIHQLQAKDRASYSLLVQGAVMEGDWSGAVEELKSMTEVGIFPNTRNLNSWAEVMERGCRPGNRIHSLNNGKSNTQEENVNGIHEITSVSTDVDVANRSLNANDVNTIPKDGFSNPNINNGRIMNGRRKRRSWKKKRDGIWLENIG